ncbi:hypothetical protein WN943_013482 [Citrus x changshan-huyou]
MPVKRLICFPNLISGIQRNLGYRIKEKWQSPAHRASKIAALQRAARLCLTQVPDNIRILEQKKCTFRCREQDASHMVDWFGRNTWDASCTRVDPVGMDDGIKGDRKMI